MASDSTTYFPSSLAGRANVVGDELATHSVVKPNIEGPSSVANEPNAKSDDLLLASVGRGSREALGLLFRRYRRTVLNVVTRILKDASEGEDLCQEVFLLIFQKANLFNPAKGTASSWILQIAYSRALNRREYLTIRQHYVAQELNEDHIVNARDPLFVDSIIARSLLTSLREQLSEEQRQTLELHFFDGYSLREIAEMTGQELGNIRHHFYRGLERLRSNVFSKKDI